MFYKYAHILGPKGSPDMILTAFDMKFDEKKDEIPPEACRPLKKLKKNNVGPDRTGFVVPIFFWTGPDRPGPDHPC